jgi:hypothetical protein
MTNLCCLQGCVLHGVVKRSGEVHLDFHRAKEHAGQSECPGRRVPHKLLSRPLWVREVECVKQIVDGRTVQRNVRIAGCRDRVRVVVTTARGQWSEVPVPLNELHQGYVVAVVVINVPSLREGGYDNQRDPGAVTEEVERLHIAGVTVAAALIEGDEDGGTCPSFGTGLDRVHYFLSESFKEVQL